MYCPGFALGVDQNIVIGACVDVRFAGRLVYCVDSDGVFVVAAVEDLEVVGGTGAFPVKYRFCRHVNSTDVLTPGSAVGFRLFFLFTSSFFVFFLFFVLPLDRFFMFFARGCAGLCRPFACFLLLVRDPGSFRCCSFDFFLMYAGLRDFGLRS